MKKSFQIFLFIMAFQMEVRVRASGTEAILADPPNCVGVSAPCSFKVPGKTWSATRGKIKVSASKGTILSEEVQGTEWKLIDGALWIQNGPAVTVKTASGEVEASSGEYWVLAEKDRVTFRNISARLIVTFKDKTTLEIPRGFEIWAGNVDSNARVQHGMVEPIRLKEHLKIWHAMYPGSKKQFLSEVQDLKDQWVDLTEQSGDIYKKVVSRKLAAIDEEIQKKVAEARRQAEAKARLRQEFYKKVFQQ